MMMPTLAVATAHAFVLTVSHGLLFRQPPFTATALLPPLLSNSPNSIVRRRAARYRPLHFRSRFQSQRPVLGKSHFMSWAISPPVSIRSAARANYVRAKPMKRHNLSTI
jgi:hypothetical protein